jgi:aromatic-L-amino-acid decarboxylase
MDGGSVQPPIPEDPLADLELAPEAMRSLGGEVLERIVSHLGSIGDLPAQGAIDPDGIVAACRALPREAPEEPQPLGPILNRYFDEWLPATFCTPGPGYLAYIPGGGLYASSLASFLAAATNRFTGVWAAAPLLAELEGRVLGWFREWMGFPASAGGLLTPGGSVSMQTAIIVAREKLLGPEIRRGTIYVSDQVHHCVMKSARLAGIHPDRIRVISTDDRLRLRPEELERAIAADRDAGLQPFLVVSSAGTTNTGAIDPLPAIGAIARREGLWHHVDGAYGAFFNLVPEMRELLTGMADADSLTLDPHKGLFLPYGTGALLVRDEADLRAVHEVTAGYLPPTADSEFYDPSSLGPELSRPYRGLPIWLAVELHGATRMRAAIAEKRALALWAADRLRELPGIELVDDPQLTVLAFRVVAPGKGDSEIDALTRRLLEGVNQRGRVYLSGATVGERYLARICILCFRTRGERVGMAIEDIAGARAELE